MRTNEMFDHLEDLLTYAHHLTHNKDLAEDLVQDVILHVLKRDYDLSNVEHPRSYMRIVLRNLFLDQHRKRLRTPPLQPIEQYEPVDNGGDGYSQIACKEILEAVECLPEKYRTVILIRLESGSSYSNMAKRLDIPIGTVMSRMNRAREHLKQLL